MGEHQSELPGPKAIVLQTETTYFFPTENKSQGPLGLNSTNKNWRAIWSHEQLGQSCWYQER